MKVNSTDFQNAVGKYLDLLEKEPIVITRNGKSVAKLTSYTDPSDFFIHETKGAYNVRNQVSYEEYLKIIEGSDQRYELIAGEIYLLASPSFQHQVIVGEIWGKLREYFRGDRCQALTAPLDIRLFGWATKFSEDPNVVQPDIVVICDPENVTEDGKYEGLPTLIVEVLSPTTKGKDLITKLELYRRSGIREYWIVDPKGKTVHQYSFDDEREPDVIRVVSGDDASRIEALHSVVFAGLELPLSAIWPTI